MHFLTYRTADTTTFDGPVVDHWYEQKIAQTANASAVKDRSDDLNLHRWVLYRLSYVPLTLILIVPPEGAWMHIYIYIFTYILYNI